MKQPTGFHEGSPPANGSEVPLLKMALYGLRQAAHAPLAPDLRTRNYVKSESNPCRRKDPCIYKSDETWPIIYVDDSAVTSPEVEDPDHYRKNQG